MHFQGLCQMTSPIGHHKSRSLWESEQSHRHHHHRGGGGGKWGGTFTVRWLRIFDLPFDQTNHILNPWNGGRPVKFSRDGQALPVHVGQSLMHLFEIGVNEYGQGSAILRKPIRIDDGRQIAVQKVFVNGQFVAATDTQTASNMIDDDGDRGKKNEQLNRLVSTLQKQSELSPNGSFLDKMTVDAVTKLLSANLSQSNGEKEGRVNGGDGRERRHRSKRHRSSRRERSRSRDRKRRRYRDRERGDRHRRRRYDSSSDYYERRGAKRRSHSEKYRRRDRRYDDDDGRERRDDQEKVINSLWTQIQFQQAIMSQSGLLGNNVAANSSMQYPSNRGGVF